MNNNNWRLNLLGVLFLIAAVIIVGRILIIQNGPQAETLKEQSDSFLGFQQKVLPVRGQVYDRWGNLLAGNKTLYQIGVELQHVKNPETIALALDVYTGADYSEVYRIASQEPSKDAVYAVLQDFVPADKIAQLEEFKKQVDEGGLGESKKKDALPPSLDGLIWNAHLVRAYPEHELASNLLGFVSREGRGYFGIEEKYNDLLSGSTRQIWVANDPNQVQSLPTPPEGASLILTIDREIQDTVEEILDRSVETTGSASGTIIVLQPETGEILALASTPRMDLNEFWDYGNVYPGSTPFNRAVSQAYEPGSVFKVFTMASALDSGAVKPNTSFLDTGVFNIGGITIQNWNLAAWGPQDMVGCMQHSLNVCLAWVASEMGAKTFYEYLQRFGIGHLTGVDMAGEVAGRLKLPGDGDWYEADLGTNSFGQGVSTTPLQMIAGVAAIANEGKMVTPHIVRAVVDNGRQYEVTPQVAGYPIKQKTARTLTDMLTTSLQKESSSALVPGYQVAGKTGTAEIPTPAGYTTGVTNASFVGWGPSDDPKFVIYVWLEKPTTSPWGSVVAAPVFSEVAQRLVILMDLPPDEVRTALTSN
ncbi:MAG: peptidoglycan D,D-transpeptidase FtsI family protein [Anaerolineales bacterium]|jgi:cell division protein FtsI/penicillin-binding protein 2